MFARKKANASKKPASSTSRQTAKAESTSGQRQEMRRDPAIDEYIAGVNPRSRALLRQLRKTIHAIVPEVEECISYRIPAFRYDGRIIAGFSATSNSCSYYPFSGTTLRTLAADVEDYSQNKSALHFDKSLPTALVRKLLKARIAEGSRRQLSTSRG